MGALLSILSKAYHQLLSRSAFLTRAQLGWQAEGCACRYLKRQGLTLIQRRYSTRFGEIDLIMRDAHVIVFVEVRYRSSRKHGGALLSVDRAKQEKLARTASQYLQAMDPHHQQETRFDVVAIEGKQKPHWVKGAFFVGE